jgi:hypothetical protein
MTARVHARTRRTLSQDKNRLNRRQVENKCERFPADSVDAGVSLLHSSYAVKQLTAKT